MQSARSQEFVQATVQTPSRGPLDPKQATRATARPFVAARRAPLRCKGVRCQAVADSSRRQTLQTAGAGLAALLLPELAPRSAQAKSAGGFLPIKDSQDGYQFLSPFGWQEVAVKGQDVVYKDVIEPLESVSVSLTPTDKANIAEFGTPEEIAATLAKNVLTPRNQDVKVLNVGERETEGRRYVEFEFASKAPNYIRHALASVTVANGKFYTLTTGANEFRWDKMKDRLKLVISSFEVQDRFPAA